MDFDHYDLFNAPQYIDFNEFVKNDGLDNGNADEYFETHKEEDDFFVPLESISPSLKSEKLVVLNQSSNSVLYTSPVSVLKNELQENDDDKEQLAEEEIKVEPIVVETLISDKTTTDDQKSSCTTQQHFAPVVVETPVSDQATTDRQKPTQHLVSVVVETPVSDEATTDRQKSTCTTQQYAAIRKSIKPPTLSIPRKVGLPSKVTVPQPFNFSTLRQRKVPEPCKDTFNFKARPVPLKVLQGDLVKVEKPMIKTTQPITVHFASDDRIRERQLRKSAPSATAQTDNERRSRSNSLSRPIAQRTPNKEKNPVPLDVATSTAHNMVQRPSSIKKNTFRLSERSRSPSIDRSKPIVIKPFSFEERDKEMLRKKDEKIRKAIKEETKTKQFHAQPLPNYAVALKRLPQKKPAPPTHAEPFKLKSDQRGNNYQEEIKRKVEEEKLQLKLQAQFKAQPNEVIYKKPFEPEKSSVPLAEPIDLLLNTDRRANEREKYQQMMKEKEAELDDLRRQEKTMKEDQEKKMTQVLRELLVHKARPAPKSRFFEVRASEKPLTDPKSPAFELLPSQRRPRPLGKENY